MVTLVHLDFETRSEIDIAKAGAYRYSEDSSTEVLVLKYRIGDNPIQTWLPLRPIPRDLKAAAESSEVVFVAHNAFFEQVIWENVCVKRMGWPLIAQHRWKCTAAKARYHALPAGLDECAQVLNLREKKDMVGSRIMKKMSKPRKATKKDSHKWHWTVVDFDALCKYCEQDVVVEENIDNVLQYLR